MGTQGQNRPGTRMSLQSRKSELLSRLAKAHVQIKSQRRASLPELRVAFQHSTQRLHASKLLRSLAPIANIVRSNHRLSLETGFCKLKTYCTCVPHDYTRMVAKTVSPLPSMADFMEHLQSLQAELNTMKVRVDAGSIVELSVVAPPPDSTINRKQCQPTVNTSSSSSWIGSVNTHEADAALSDGDDSMLAEESGSTVNNANRMLTLQYRTLPSQEEVDFQEEEEELFDLHVPTTWLEEERSRDQPPTPLLPPPPLFVGHVQQSEKIPTKQQQQQQQVVLERPEIVTVCFIGASCRAATIFNNR